MKKTVLEFMARFMMENDITPADIEGAYIALATYKSMTDKNPDEEAWLKKNLRKRIKIDVESE